MTGRRADLFSCNRLSNFLKCTPPTLAVLAIAAAATYQLAPRTVVAGSHSSETDFDRFANVLTAGYDTDTLLAAGVPLSSIEAFYGACLRVSPAVGAFATAQTQFSSAKTELERVRDEIRKVGLTDALATERVAASADLDSAENNLLQAESDLAASIGSEAGSLLTQETWGHLRLMTARRAWQVPAAWRLANVTSDDDVRRAERLAAIIESNPDAELNQLDAAFLAAIQGHPDVAAASFRIESESTAGQLALTRFVASLELSP